MVGADRGVDTVEARFDNRDQSAAFDLVQPELHQRLGRGGTRGWLLRSGVPAPRESPLGIDLADGHVETDAFTIGVENLDESIATVAANGGKDAMLRMRSRVSGCSLLPRYRGHPNRE